MSLLDPSELAQSFSQQWELFGNTSSKELIELWTKIFTTFNESNQRNKDNSNKKYSVVPAVTGSGKTLCYQWYAAELIKDSSNDCGMLIVTNLINEANKAVENINKWSISNSAVTYNSDSWFKQFGNEKHLNDFQVVVISHEYFKRHHHLKSVNSRIYEQVASYKDTERSIVVIDESIEVINHIGINKDDIEEIGSWSWINKETVGIEHELIEYLKNNFITLFPNSKKSIEVIGSNKDILIASISQYLNIQPREVVDLFSMKESLKAIRKDPKLVNDSISGKTSLIQKINDIKYLLDDHLYRHTSGNRTHYRTSILELPDKSLTILDATANVNKVYDHFPHTEIIKLPIVKTYENVTLTCLKLDDRSKLGKDSFKDKIKELHHNNISNLTAVPLFSNKEYVVFTHKTLKDQLQQEKIDNFGNLTGVNTYKDVEVIIIYGIHYLPQYVYYDYKFQSSNQDVSVFNGEVTDLQYSNITANIIQMINRGRCRKIVNGKAPEMQVTLLLPSNKNLNKIIIESIRKEMTGINIAVEDSDLKMTYEDVGKLDGRVTDGDRRLIDCIDINEMKIKLSDLYKCSGANTKDKQKRIRRNATNQKYKNTYIGVKLKQLGYKPTKAVGGQWYFVKK